MQIEFKLKSKMEINAHSCGLNNGSVQSKSQRKYVKYCAQSIKSWSGARAGKAERNITRTDVSMMIVRLTENYNNSIIKSNNYKSGLKIIKQKERLLQE